MVGEHGRKMRVQGVHRLGWCDGTLVETVERGRTSLYGLEVSFSLKMSGGTSHPSGVVMMMNGRGVWFMTKSSVIEVVVGSMDSGGVKAMTKAVLSENFFAADKGCFGLYMKLYNFTLLFMTLQVELRLNKG